MVDPQTVKSVVDLGGLVLFVLLVGLIGWGAVKKDPWWVPGFVYRREVERADHADAQADRNSKAIERIAVVLDVGHLDDSGGR